jgi:hypothetical protein
VVCMTALTRCCTFFKFDANSSILYGPRGVVLVRAGAHAVSESGEACELV